MSRPRGTTNRDARGSTRDRARRRRWLVDTFGDPSTGTVACHMRAHPDCRGTLTEKTVSADRYPIPGCDGGTYRRDNIRPGCDVCQMHTGGKLGAARRLAGANT